MRSQASARLGLAAIFWGCVGLIAGVLGVISSPVVTASAFVLMTGLPLMTILAGSFLLPPPAAGPFGEATLLHLRITGLLTLLLGPFVPWMLFSSRNTYLTFCAFSAFFSLAFLLQRVCEYIRLNYLARACLKQAVRAHWVKLLVQFFLVTPVGVVAVMITLRQWQYNIKATSLMAVIWQQTSWLTKTSVVVACCVCLAAALGLMMGAFLQTEPVSATRTE